MPGDAGVLSNVQGSSAVLGGSWGAVLGGAKFCWGYSVVLERTWRCPALTMNETGAEGVRTR